MIELTTEEHVYDVTVSATIGVHRTVRVIARGEGHAREVAKTKVGAEEGPTDWTFPPTGQIVTVGKDHIASLMTGMCPTLVEADARDRNGKPLFIGDEITYVRSGKKRRAQINDVFDGKQMLWCDENLFSIGVDEVEKA